MKKLAKLLLIVLVLSCPGAFSAPETIEDMLSTPIPQYAVTRNQLLICRQVQNWLEQVHYAAHPISAAVSSAWYREYFKSLDPQHVYFLQSDWEEFSSYEPVLWNSVRKIANVEFAFKLYQRYLERIQQRAQFVLAHADDKQDFSVSESLLLDRKDAMPPLTVKEQHDLWRKLLKNEILQYKIDEENNTDSDDIFNDDEDNEEEDNEEKAKDGAKPEAAQKEAAPAEAEKAAPSKEPKAKKPRKTFAEKIEALKKNYARFYKRRAEMEDKEVLEYFLNALCHTYDPHTTYMSPATKENFDIDMSLSLQGIGATLSIQDGYVTIVDIVPGGPADKEGSLKKGDRITAVAQDGQDPVDTIDMPLNKAVSMIRGKKGTKVHLTVLPEGSSNPSDITIVRDEIKLTDSEAKSEFRQVDLDDGRQANILIMHLPSFYCDFEAKFKRNPNYKSTTRDMLALLEKAKGTTPVDGVILDMRGNGGGALDEAVSLSGLFMGKEAVVQTKYYNGECKSLKDSNPAVQFNGPVLVMVDRFSASAAEILAACLQDLGRAVIVGDKSTHGKGTVQNMFDLSQSMRSKFQPSLKKQDYGSLKITIGKFYRINGGSTQVKGVTPDIIFPSLTDDMKLGEDKLPYALPWDEISPAQYSRSEALVPVMPELLKRSEQRRAASEEFQTYLKTNAIYAKFQDIEEIPLEINARRDFVKQQDEADKIIKHYRKTLSKNQKGKAKQKHANDVILNESVNIMTDMIRLLPAAN